jgi:hypothetical protein
MSNSVFKQANNHWDSAVGVGVRALLNLEKSAGALLWFRHTIIANYDDADYLQVGQVVRFMLAYKVAEMDRLNEIDN